MASPRPETTGARCAATRVLCAFGPLAALIFLTADIAGALATPGYSMVGQAISELMERGAPAKASSIRC